MANEIIRIEPLSFNDKTDELINAVNTLISNMNVVDDDLSNITSVIGLPLSRLNTQEKDNLINAINSFLARGDVDALTLIGDLLSLETAEKANLVSAMNSLQRATNNAVTVGNNAAGRADVAITSADEAKAAANDALSRSRGSVVGAVGAHHYIVVASPIDNAFTSFATNQTGQIQVLVPGELAQKAVKFEILISEADVFSRYIVSYQINASGVSTNLSYIQMCGPARAVTFGKSAVSSAVAIGEADTVWNKPSIQISNVVVTGSTSFVTAEPLWTASGWNISVRTAALATAFGKLSGSTYFTAEAVDIKLQEVRTSSIDTAYENSLAIAIALG